MSDFNYFLANVNLEQNEDNNLDEEINLDDYEMPQLMRRNGAINQPDYVAGHFILDKNLKKIYQEHNCPICLSADEELYPLKCGHTFCEDDLQHLIYNSKHGQGLVECPICRQFQIVESFEQLFQLSQQFKVEAENELQIQQ